MFKNNLLRCVTAFSLLDVLTPRGLRTETAKKFTFKLYSSLPSLVVQCIYYYTVYSGLQGVLKSIIHSQQDFGGTPTLFGIASVLNHISEMAAYFYSFKIIAKIGHIKVLALGLLCNVIRFIYISFITWPWLILPFEFVQGIPIM